MVSRVVVLCVWVVQSALIQLGRKRALAASPDNPQRSGAAEGVSLPFRPRDEGSISCWPVYASAGLTQPDPRADVHDAADNGRNGDRSARTPLDRMTPELTASTQPISPVATFTQVTASVSITFGGVPRVCRGPGIH